MRQKKPISLLLALLLTLSLMLGGLTAWASEDDDSVEVINIFSFNDFHGTVDKTASGSNPGADRFVAIVEHLMAENPNSVLLGAGDLYQGSPLSNVFLGEPVSDMIKYLGVEYSALGNHEFDWGADKIEKFAKDGDITFLAANIFIEDTDERPDFCEPYAVIEVGSLKIGLVGLTTVLTPSLVKAEYVEGFEFRKPGDWLLPIIDTLRDDEGCDVIIALTHMGVTVAAGAITGGEAAELAELGLGFDAIIGGHTHVHAADTVNGTPIVVGGWNGRGLGNLEIKADEEGDITITPKVYLAADMNGDAILPSNPLQVNEEITAIIDQYWEDIGPVFAEVVGLYGIPITSRAVQAEWANRLVYDYILRETGESYVTITNAGGWRDTSPYNRLPGDGVTLGYLYTVMPFDNEIVLMDLAGEYLLEILTAPAGTFISAPVIAGAYEEDGVWKLANGDVIEADDMYLVSGTDFIWNPAGTGGDNFAPILVNGENVTFMGVPLRDAMIEELQYRMAKGVEIEKSMDYFNIIKTVYDDNFTDLDDCSDEDMAEWVAKSFEYGIMAGRPGGVFDPQGNITIAEAITVAAKMHAIYNGTPSAFADAVFPDSFVDYAVENGIIEEDEFEDLDAYATRAQLVGIWVNILPAAEFDALNEFDPDDVDDVDEDDLAIILFYVAGIVTGMDDDTFGGDELVTREQAAVMLVRIANPAERFAADDDDDDDDGEEEEEDPALETPDVPYAMFVETAPVFGTNDAVWNSAGVMELDVSKMKNANTATTGTARVLWDDDFLYVRVVVTDDSVFTGSGGSQWLNDGVEIFLGPGTGGANQYRIGASNDKSGQAAADSWTSIEAPGYIVEVKLAKKTLVFEDGAIITFEVQINDSTSAGGDRDTAGNVISWTGTPDTGYNSFASFADSLLLWAP
jgi:2',3'-cyclic-nucleotide 2'-phosphodiesterase (5'-nucleotidase family)